VGVHAGGIGSVAERSVADPLSDQRGDLPAVFPRVPKALAVASQFSAQREIQGGDRFRGCEVDPAHGVLNLEDVEQSRLMRQEEASMMEVSTSPARVTP
jgi:hypothetical protein